MSIEIITFLMLGSLLTVIILGAPIGLSLASVATIFGLALIGPGISNIFMLRLYGLLADYIIVAVPLFVFMGILIEKTGIAMKLFDAMYVIFGRLRGGLAVSAVIACTIFAAATGIVGASVVTMGIIALPAMLKYKYSPELATGSICAAGTLGILIPPSIMILVYGPLAGVSVGTLFAAAFAPGILLSILYVIYILVRCYVRPADGPAASDSEILKITVKEKLMLFFTSVFPVVGLILAVLGTILFGLASPTEAAAVGCFFSGVLAILYKKLNIAVLRDAVVRSLKTTCMVYLVLMGAGFFTGVFLRIGGNAVISNLFLSLPISEAAILWLMWFIVIILGMFIDWMGIVMIVVPIFTPIILSLGIDPVWFAMMTIVVLQTSFITPPFAFSIFVLQGIAPPEIKTHHIYKGIIPFLALQLIGITLCYLFPEIILFVPRYFGLL